VTHISFRLSSEISEGDHRVVLWVGADSTSLARIPVLPISYADAQPLLTALQGPVVPDNWRGALPLTYRIGPTQEKVHLKLAFDWGLKPVRDVIATMRGMGEPDLWVLRANHYDGWVNGAADPISGQIALLEEARAIWPAGPSRLETQKNHHVHVLGRRGTDALGFYRMGGAAC
jgi:hypothetical protein